VKGGDDTKTKRGLGEMWTKGSGTGDGDGAIDVVLPYMHQQYIDSPWINVSVLLWCL
jgi:hypothetical protein